MKLDYIHERMLSYFYVVPIGALTLYLFDKCYKCQQDGKGRTWFIRAGYCLASICTSLTFYAFIFSGDRMYHDGEPLAQNFFHAPQSIIWFCLFCAFLGGCFLNYDYYLRLKERKASLQEYWKLAFFIIAFLCVISFAVYVAWRFLGI